MFSKTKAFMLLAAALVTLSAAPQSANDSNSAPEYTAGGEFKFPEHYRDWVYLTSGFDMSYTADMQMGNHVFDNVFVNPRSYRAFLETGTWPDKTTLVLEFRRAQSKGSINQSGNFQNVVTGVEIHVKDESRFPGKWGFFPFDQGNKTAKLIPTTASCYSCHSAHAAVDTTFVQFYPTLLPIARSHDTFSAEYKKELETATK